MSVAEPVVPDVDLVSGVLAGDQAAFAAVYDRYADKLFDFAHSMLRSREDAADAVADTFVTTAEKLSQLRDPSLLRPWLYSVTRRECLKRLESRKRVAFDGEDRLVVMPDEDLTPEEHAESESLRRLVWDAAEGLNERDRAVLDLHLRQGLDGAELAAAMDTTASHAYVMMNRLRGQLERSLGALLIARLGREDCDDLERLLADWDGRFSPLVRKRVARHVDDCETCTRRRAMIINPWAAFAAIPPLAAPAELRDRVLGSVQLVAHSTGPWWRRRIAALVAGLLVLVAVVGAAWFWPSDGEEGGEPTPAPTTSAPATPSASPAPTPTPTRTTPTPGAAVLEVGPRSLDLSSRRSATFTITNPGEQDLTFTATPTVGWFTVSTGAGTVAPGASTTITVTRGGIDEGTSAGEIRVTAPVGTSSVAVTATVRQGPSIGRVTTSDAGCQGGRLLSVTVPVSDASGVASVTVRWSGSASGTTRLSRSGARWTGVIGPYPSSDGGAVLRITAVDDLGETSTARTTRSFDPCPG